MGAIAGHPYWELVFDEHGTLTSGSPDAVIAQMSAAGIDNLFVFSHGWNTQQGQAEQLYQQMFPLIATAAGQRPALGTIGFVGVIWPSIWFPDTPGAAQALPAAGMRAVGASPAGPVDVTVTLTGTEISDALAGSFEPAKQDLLAEMGRLIDQGQRAAAAGSATHDEQARNVARFHALLQQLTAGTVDGLEDSGETALFDTADPLDAYQTLTTAMGNATGGDAQGLGDIFNRIWDGAKDALRIASFWAMKARAGTVGRAGLGPLLESLHTHAPAIRVNLIGHSFGARLVSFALSGITGPSASPLTSLLLIQGAFSHWCFASQRDMPFGQPGALFGFADRVHGPLVSTFSKFDWAVGTWYPKAAFLAGDDTQAIDPAPRWGGMGSDGFQASAPQADLNIGPPGTDYHLLGGTFHRADGNLVITNTGQSAFAGAHSDIIHPQIAWLAVCAANPDQR